MTSNSSCLWKGPWVASFIAVFMLMSYARKTTNFTASHCNGLSTFSDEIVLIKSPYLQSMSVKFSLNTNYDMATLRTDQSQGTCSMPNHPQRGTCGLPLLYSSCRLGPSDVFNTKQSSRKHLLSLIHPWRLQYYSVFKIPMQTPVQDNACPSPR